MCFTSKEQVMVRLGKVQEEIKALQLSNSENRGSTYGLHMSDCCEREVTSSTLISSLRAKSKEFQSLTEILSLMDSGQYGQCLGCGNKIPQKRLEAMPAAKLCIECQDATENGTPIFTLRQAAD